MTEIIAIVNQKGGVGKTTTAINISACLAAAGRKTLLMDADQQGSSTIGLGVNKQKLTASFYDFLMSDLDFDQIVRETMIPGFHILPAKDDLTGVNHKIMGLAERDTLLKRRMEQKLAGPDRAGYDFIIIDSPPNLDLMTINIMTAADRLIIPTKPDYLSMDGLVSLFNTYKRIQESGNPKLSIIGVLITINLASCRLSREAGQDLKRVCGELLFDNVIPQNIRLAEAPGHCLPITLYDRHSAGAVSYRAVTGEILARLNSK
ncbi:MAG: ParA family protein [Deltaproteobacteria bacterium]|nr:ParA family protein [Deltaproteobacteria bacterium]